MVYNVITVNNANKGGKQMEKDTVFFNVEKGEREKLKSDAHAHGMNISEYLRWLISIERIKMSDKKVEE